MLFLYMSLIDDDINKVKFEEIYNQYKKQMFFVANNILHDSYLAEDAVHDAFLGIAKNFSRIKSFEAESIKSYVLISAKHSALQYLRSKFKHEFVDISELYNLEDEKSSNAFNEYEMLDYATSIINSLPEKYSEAMFLHFVLGLSAKEISLQLSQNASTVRQHISRGKKLFIEIMTKGENNEKN